MSSRVDTTPCAHINPNIFQLEKKPKHVLCHEFGAGSPCLKCDCSGLDLHFWRKICKVCSCRMDDHDIIMPEMDHGKVIVGRLFDFIPAFEQKLNLSSRSTTSSLPRSSPSSLTQSASRIAKKAIPNLLFNVRMEDDVEKEKAVTEYTWVPTGDRVLVSKYFDALPENERPIAGTQGAVDRRRKLQYQLPHHDTDITAAKSIVSDADREQHSRFLATLKEKVVGVGQLIEWNDENRVDAISIHGATGIARDDSTVGADESSNYGRCEACHKKMKRGEVAIVTDHGRPDEVWHPNCFRCRTCDQRLVDMLYFYKDGCYYCGRHFGDLMYPRCSGCDELIFSKEYTYAEDKNWHFDHFCCFGCDMQLGGHRYMMRDEQPYCFGCYMSRFARTCHSCGAKIAPDQQRISFKHLHWHALERCFQCRNCGMVMLNKKFIMKNEEVFCSVECKKEYFK
uniref:Uncharacterized protein n=1 Tax=Parascaris univalens TaxID=6257 RepID=A0A915CGD9_PARUN